MSRELAKEKSVRSKIARGRRCPCVSGQSVRSRQGRERAKAVVGASEVWKAESDRARARA